MRIPCLLAVLPVLGSALLAQNPPTGFTYQTITDGVLNRGSALAFAPDGRLFVLERNTGVIRVVRDGALQPGNWAVLSVRTSTTTEQGLLGLAFDPAFLTNGHVYVYYSTPAGTENVIARLQEVGGAGTNLTQLSPAGAIPAVSIHNGGRMVFGFDGKLYVGTGDRSSSSTAQSLSSWNGKILRFDVPNLGIPADNPFANSPVWSYGHRNQFGLTVHPVTGDLFQTENGQNTYDEVNRIVRGGNYGWPTVEGPEPVPNAAFVDPLRVYNPTPDPVGTCFYFGNNYPAAYANNWFWIEYTAGRIHRMVLNAAANAVVSDVIWDDLVQGYDMQMGPDGNLWVLHNDTSGARGGDEIGRYVHQGEPNPSVNLMAVSNRSVGGSITFGWHGSNGDLFFPWASFAIFGAPVTTPYGQHWVPADIVLPLQFVTADDRAYRGMPLPNLPAFIGALLHSQAARVNPVTLAVDLTNPASLVLR